MAATTGQLGFVTPTQGTLTGTWGDTVNNGITEYTNIAIAGTLTLTNDGAVTLANTTGDNSASNITSTLTGAGTVTAQFAIVRVTGTLTTAKVVTGPSYSKTYTVVNAATGGIVTFKASGQTGVSVAVGETAFVYFNGTDYVKVVGTATAGAAGGSTTQVQFNSSGILSGSSSLTWNGTSLSATQIDITAQGTLRLQDTTGGEYVALRAPATLGANYTLTFPADDGTSGQALITDGSGVLSWSTAASGDVYGPASSTDNAIVRFDSTTGKLIQNSVVTIADTTGDMSGVGTLSAATLNLTNALGVAYGGTGQTTLATGALGYGQGTSAHAALAIGTAGQILTVNSGATAPQWSTLSGVAVTTFSAGTTGFTPSSATAGAVTLAGTLATTNGGTGLTSFTSGGVVYASSTSALATGVALSFDSTNTRLGVGTNAPVATLQANKADGGYVFGLSGTTKGLRVATDATQTSIQGVDNTLGVSFQPLQIGGSYLSFAYSGTTEGMRLTSTGLGIGTSSPTEKLTVAGNIKLGTSGTSYIYGPATTGRSFFSNSDSTAYIGIYGSSYGSSLDSVISFVAGTSNSMTYNASGNLGLGVTPSAWNSLIKAYETSGGSLYTYNGGNIGLAQNAYFDGAWKYKTTSQASSYYQANAIHYWNIAASGTAGNVISFTQAMTLDASGNLMVGTTSAAGVLTVVGANTSDGATAKYIANIRNSGAQTSGVGAGIAFTQTMSSFNAVLCTIQGIKENGTSDNYASALSFYTRANGADLTEKARIDSSGNFLVGTTATAVAKMTIVSTTNPALTLPNIAEIATISATAATGTINYDLTTQSVLYYTTSASANFTMNVRGNSGLTLNSMLAIGQSVTMAFLCTTGATAYYQTAMTIDGTSVTPKWQGGTAPTSGNASSIDVYSYTIIKTAASTYTVLASQTKFA